MNRRALLLLSLSLCGPAALATPKDTLVYQIPSAIAALEPAQAVTGYDVLVVQQMYEALYRNEFGSYKPQLATGYTQSKDGRVTTFTLRRGVRFHDGSSMTCMDAEYSLRRTLLVGNETSQAAQIRASVLGIGGFTPEIRKTFTFAKLASTVKCNAAGQLVLTLDRNVPSLIDAVSQAYVVPMKALVAAGDWSGTARDFGAWVGKDVSNSALTQKPSGTGAYTFVSRDPSRLIFRAFAGYWGGAPALKNVILQKVDSDTARVLAVQKGDADIIAVPDRDTLARLRGVAGVKVYETLPQQLQSQVVTMVMFNQNIQDGGRLPAGQLAENNVPVNFFSDIHVRRAFAAAFDTQTFVRDALQGKGLALNSSLPYSSWANDPALRPTAFNLKAAEAEFKLAFGGKLWTTGFTLPAITITGQGLSEVVSGIIKQNIEAINPKFHVQVTTGELSSLNASLLGGKLTVVPLTWGGADPDTVLRGLYGSDGILSTALGIKDTRLQTLLDQGRDTVGQAARKPIYRTILNYVGQQAYGFPLQVSQGFGATAADLRGFEDFNKTNLFSRLSK
ncbi:ABC transporter substrate-binding protein [Deinococcus yunweiensis]|uniref:ABC transporter substrate-binding protein n=1 Tax=Deinococcus yunweiensis TaxID=367282 RepID=UPI00398E6773